VTRESHLRQSWILAAAVVAAAGGGALAQAPPPTQVPVFRSGVELVSVDVNVVDKNGNPIRALRPDQFEVTVDGKPRRVISAESVDFVPGGAEPASSSTATATPPAPVPPRVYSTNDTAIATAAPGRLVFLVVDQGSFQPLEVKAATEAARRFMGRLQVQDRVGLITFPPPGPSLAPSTERTAVGEALIKIVGTAEVSPSSRAARKVSLSESLDIEARDDFALDNVVARECRGVSGPEQRQCSDEVVMQARLVARLAEERSLRTLTSLQAVMRALAAMPERKTVVLISAGLPASDRPGVGLDTQTEIAAIGRLAAAANSSLYVLHVDHTFLKAFSPEENWISTTMNRDEVILRGGLETMAGASGGTIFTVVNGANRSFDRVLRETASAYVLGVEPTDTDRNGQPHTIKVAVKVPGAEVRSRREFVMVPTQGDTVESRLTAALKAQRLAVDLPLGVSAHTLGQAESGEVRVLIAARVGRGLTAPLKTDIAYLLTDPSGRSIGSASESGRLPLSHTSVVGAASYMTVVGVRPGDYLLRLAAVDEAGRVGSVEHWFSASLASGDGIRMSDLLLLDPTAPSSEDLAPVTDGRIRAKALDAYMEIYPHRVDMHAPEVVFSIASRPDDPPLLRTFATVTPKNGGKTHIAEALLDIRTLPPGDYVAALSVLDGQRPIGKRIKRFTVEGVPGATSR
jgi:VWFA-related protein